jgi:hypothetical protein
MRPFRSTVAVLATLALALAALSPAVMAQEDAAGHPLVGAWWVRPEGMPATEGPGNLGSFGADGTFVGVDPGGGVSIGAWRPTGERTFEATFHFPIQDPEGRYVGHGAVSVRGEVSEDGQTFSGAATTDVPLPEGGRSGPRGEAPLGGTRVTADPIGPGTSDPEGTPAADGMGPVESPVP